MKLKELNIESLLEDLEREYLNLLLEAPDTAEDVGSPDTILSNVSVDKKGFEDFFGKSFEEFYNSIPDSFGTQKELSKIELKDTSIRKEGLSSTGAILSEIAKSSREKTPVGAIEALQDVLISDTMFGYIDEVEKAESEVNLAAARTLRYLDVIKTLHKIIEGFDSASSAGFFFENFFARYFTEAGYTPYGSPIEDVVEVLPDSDEGDKKYFSLKLLKPDSIIEGSISSIENFFKSNNEITYVVAEKTESSSKKMVVAFWFFKFFAKSGETDIEKFFQGNWISNPRKEKIPGGRKEKYLKKATEEGEALISSFFTYFEGLVEEDDSFNKEILRDLKTKLFNANAFLRGAASQQKGTQMLKKGASLIDVYLAGKAGATEDTQDIADLVKKMRERLESVEDRTSLSHSIKRGERYVINQWKGRTGLPQFKGVRPVETDTRKFKIDIGKLRTALRGDTTNNFLSVEQRSLTVDFERLMEEAQKRHASSDDEDIINIIQHAFKLIRHLYNFRNAFNEAIANNLEPGEYKKADDEVLLASSTSHVLLGSLGGEQE